MRTEATVIAIENEYAIVESERSSACEGCHKKQDGEGCSVCSLMGGERKISAKAKNPISAGVGDRVIIESATGRMLWYAVLVFLLPLAVGILAYITAAMLTDQGVWQFLAALLGFLGTFIGVFAYSEIVRKKRCDIEIVEIIVRHDSAN